MSEKIRQFIDEFTAVLNAHDVQRVASFYAPDYEEIDVAQAEPHRGRESVRRNLHYYFRAFPDLELVMDECVIEDGRVVLFWHWRGTHRGAFMHIPPTGRPVAVRGASLLTLKDDQIWRVLRIWDLAGLLRTLGLLPEL